ncbi:MAG: rhomboid family intramembrane serine protease, partial [Rudaea sp.]
MPFFIYGNDARTGIVAKRVYTDAETEAEARAHGETLGLAVTAVVPCHADENPGVVAEKVPGLSVSPRPATASALSARQNKQAFAAFTRTLEDETPTTYVTYALIAVNVLVFAAMVFSGVSATSPTGMNLIDWGSDFGMETARGQWWRLFTAMFVHIGFFHLVFNMIAFVYVGPTVERMFGNLGFLVLYVVSGLGGSLLALYLNPMLIHAGASGAIFGIYGALLAVLLRERDSIP